MAERGVNPLVFLPVVVFAALAGGFYWGMTRENPDELPSALEGEPAPRLALPALERYGDGFDPAVLDVPGPKLVNFWASWCVPCRAEHPMLESLSESGLTIHGINYKDQTSAAQGFLDELGNPFAEIGVDDTGRAAIEWGVYGVPETFVVDGAGRIMTRYPGPITREVYETRLRPAIEAARDATGQ